ncbi:MAG: hypothetical protein AB7O43_18695 [Hyphomicrobiaceae bacterium]
MFLLPLTYFLIVTIAGNDEYRTLSPANGSDEQLQAVGLDA